MRVAVITPYYKPSLQWLRQCHESVLAQTHACTHFMVADGLAQSEVEVWEAQHIILGGNSGDYGDTPRAIGALSAIGQGFEAVSFLDADNWYQPEHIASLVALHQETRADICISHRYLYRINGTRLALCHETDGEYFADTNCMFLTRPAFHIAAFWALMDPRLHAIGDRVVMHKIRTSKLRRAFSNQPTVAYRTAFPGAYRRHGETPPPEATRTTSHVDAAYAYLESRGGPNLRPKPPRP